MPTNNESIDGVTRGIPFQKWVWPTHLGTNHPFILNFGKNCCWDMYSQDTCERIRTHCKCFSFVRRFPNKINYKITGLWIWHTETPPGSDHSISCACAQNRNISMRNQKYSLGTPSPAVWLMATSAILDALWEYQSHRLQWNAWRISCHLHIQV